MKTLLLLLFILIPYTIPYNVATANPIDDQCPQFVSDGAPVSPIADTLYLCKHHYAINYRKDTKTPEYVVEHPTLSEVTGKSKRKDDFRADPTIPAEFQSTLSDYAGQPYDRGHLVPAGDSTETDADMSESFFLSNMVPQNQNNNRGIWKQLETVVRNSVLSKKDLYVASGTIYNKGYKEIGTHKVGVPSHVWKVIINKTDNKSIGFIFPNTALPVGDLFKYAVSVSEVEKQTGIDFSPKKPGNESNTDIEWLK